MYINIDNYGLRVYVNMHNENGSFEMPKYIPIDALTDKGKKTVRKHPDMVETANMEINNKSAKALGRYSVLIQYDFINIIEASNNVAIADLSLEPESMGTIQIITLPAIPVDDFAAKMT